MSSKIQIAKINFFPYFYERTLKRTHLKQILSWDTWISGKKPEDAFYAPMHLVAKPAVRETPPAPSAPSGLTTLRWHPAVLPAARQKTWKRRKRPASIMTVPSGSGKCSAVCLRQPTGKCRTWASSSAESGARIRSFWHPLRSAPIMTWSPGRSTPGGPVSFTRPSACRKSVRSLPVSMPLAKGGKAISPDSETWNNYLRIRQMSTLTSCIA